VGLAPQPLPLPLEQELEEFLMGDLLSNLAQARASAAGSRSRNPVSHKVKPPAVQG
jgi:hypothetical protein